MNNRPLLDGFSAAVIFWFPFMLLNLYRLQKLRKLIIMIINQPSFYHLREIVREAETSRKRPGFYNTLCTYKFPKLAHFNFRYILNSCRINIHFKLK